MRIDMPSCSFKNCRHNHDHNCFAKGANREGCEFLNMVEVVRCKDCVFFQYTAGTPWCNWWRDVIGLLDYCSNGKGGHADG